MKLFLFLLVFLSIPIAFALTFLVINLLVYRFIMPKIVKANAQAIKEGLENER